MSRPKPRASADQEAPPIVRPMGPMGWVGAKHCDDQNQCFGADAASCCNLTQSALGRYVMGTYAHHAEGLWSFCHGGSMVREHNRTHTQSHTHIYIYICIYIWGLRDGDCHGDEIEDFQPPRSINIWL